MRCLITVEGKLRIEAETETEGYALKCWYGESCENENKTELECSPKHTLTLGPQPIILLPAEHMLYKHPVPPPLDALRTVYSLAKEADPEDYESLEEVRQWLEPLIEVIDEKQQMAWAAKDDSDRD